MANETQETLYRIYASLSGGTASGMGGEMVTTAIEAAAGSTTTNSEKKDAGGGAAEIAMDVAKSGLGLVPLVTTLSGLFGGGGPEEAAPLVKYALPASREFRAAETGSGLSEVDYDQAGMPRAMERGAAGTTSLPQVNVTVQAMDARSFLDRSSEIAAAVREAMLNLNSINDVVSDL